MDVEELTSPRSTGGTGLPTMLDQVPVAVLVIDLTTSEVTYANSSAVSLSGALALPVGVDRWSRAAGLEDLDGDPLSETPASLGRVAGGEAVAGEPVRITRRGVNLTDGSDASADALWSVTGFPLADADALERMALVVFFELAEGAAGRGDSLRDRAVVATELSFTISDPQQPDNPLIWANPAFTAMTGYALDEVLGRNCRFLQGDEADQPALAELREALRADRPVTVTLVNFRKDGARFYNQLSVSPVLDGEGRLVNHVGVQYDVTARVTAEQEREAAHAAERTARAEAEAARADAERSRGALAMLAEATSVLAATLDPAEALDRLARLVVPMLADWCVINLVDRDSGQMLPSVVLRDSQDRDALLARFAELEPQHLTAASPVTRVLAGEGPLLMAMDEEVVRGHVDADELARVATELGLVSAMVVPLMARRRVLGTLALVSGVSGRRYDADDLATAADLGRRAALAVDNAWLFEREHRVAETLQRSLLPDLPEVPGLEHAAVYRASSSDAQVGGDFYDLLVLPDGATGVVIGDVMGHDLVAAAGMGQLRGVLRSYAFDSTDAATVLDRTDALVQGLGVLQMATVLYGRLAPSTEGGVDLSWANAGHVPPLVLAPDGSARWLDPEPDPVLGVPSPAPRSEHRAHLEPGSLLVLCTDGVVERRGADLDEGMATMLAAVRDCRPGAGVAEVAECVLATAAGGGDDDVALLVIRVL